MAAGAAKERPDRREMTQDDEGHCSYRRTYIVTCSTIDGAQEVLRAPDLPLWRDPYQTDKELDVFSRVVRRRPRQLRNTRHHWEVDIEYEFIPPEQYEQDPRLQRAHVGPFTYEEATIPAIATLKATVGATSGSTGIFKEPYRNSMGDPFPVQPQVEDGIGTLEITRNEDSFSPAWAMSWANAVNNDAWGGASTGQLKLKGAPTCVGEQTAVIDDAIIRYFPVVYRIQFRYEGWALRPLDEGNDYRISTSSTGGRFPFIDDHGNPYVGKLDGKGRPLACNKWPKGTSTAHSGASTLSSTVTAVYLKFNHYRKRAFADLQLPESMSSTEGFVEPP